jgi:hypothetical protein
MPTPRRGATGRQAVTRPSAHLKSLHVGEISGHALTLSHDCSTPGCLNEADASGLCRSCQQPAANGKAKVRFEKTGLVVDGELDDDELRALLRRLGRIENAVRWWLGDALCLVRNRWPKDGHPSFGDTWDKVLQGIGLEPTTGAHYRRVARAVPIERRRERLSWSHHERVAALPPAEQEEWLERAERGGMSVDALHVATRRNMLSLGKSLAKGTPATAELDQVQPRIIAPAESIARWKSVAAERGITLGALAVEALDLLVAS